MAEAREFPLPGLDVVKMKVDDCILVATNEDRDARSAKGKQNEQARGRIDLSRCLPVMLKKYECSKPGDAPKAVQQSPRHHLAPVGATD
jgi:hypothetical protein